MPNRIPDIVGTVVLVFLFFCGLFPRVKPDTSSSFRCLLIIPCVLSAVAVSLDEIGIFFHHGSIGQAAFDRFLLWFLLHPYTFATYTCCLLIAMLRMKDHDWMRALPIVIGFISLIPLLAAVCINMMVETHGGWYGR